MILFSLFIVPVIIAVAVFLFSSHKVTWKELTAQIAAQLIIAGIMVVIIYTANTGDREVWGGRVTGKKKVEVSCSHSYDCFCYDSCTTDSQGHQSCIEICQTCYEHDHDYDWDVYTSIGTTIEIDRIDRQGVDMPPRWAAVIIKEPVAVSHYYTNYIKGAPHTLFKQTGIAEKYFKGKPFPQYPGNIYDYYRINRLVSIGVQVDAKAWNHSLANLNADLGSGKQQMSAVVIVKNQDEMWFEALRELWLGGKKNDIIPVINIDDEGNITWVDIMAWAKNDIFRVSLRDDILDIGKLDRDKIISAMRKNITQHYVRKPMAEFEYLRASVQPSLTQFIIAGIISLLVSIGLAIFFIFNDPFNDERRRYYY